MQASTAAMNAEVSNREYEAQLRFEMLLADLSARFVNLPGDQVDAEIKEAQRQVCDCLGLDFSALWQNEAEDPGRFFLTHYFRRQDGPPIPSRMRADEQFPWMHRAILANKAIVLSSVEELPADAELDRKTLLHLGLKNGLLYPLSAGGEMPLGAVSFHDMAAVRTWSEPLVKRLQLVAQVFANALVRKRSEQALRESEARLSLATEAADAGPWILDLPEEHFWVGPKIMELFGLPPADHLEVARFMELVHPEDRATVRAALADAAQCMDNRKIEYRVVRPDGVVRWMQSRGRMYRRADGETLRLTGITSDITERKAREADVRTITDRITAAIDLAGLGFYESLHVTQVVFLDHRAHLLLGVPQEHALGVAASNFWRAHLHPDDKPALMEFDRQLKDGRQDWVTAEYRYQHPQRGTIWLHHLSRVLLRDANGQVLRNIGVLRDITEHKTAEAHLRKALDEVKQLRDRLQQENMYLREQVLSEPGHGSIVGESAPIKKMLALARKVAPTDSAVLIMGETGTGKELLAQAIHDLSARKDKVMVKVNCAALPALLIESELFGREKGAYTGAMTQQAGRFEVADGATIFLDEIGDLPLDLQVKLLRILQDGQYERLGSHRVLRTNVRVIAATNRDLTAMVRAGSFREDLFHRLNVFPIEVPPLRARSTDIPSLVWRFIQEFNHKMGRAIDSIPNATMEQLKQYFWPGNVRELRNVIERAIIVSEGHSLRVRLPEIGPPLISQLATLEELERNHILHVLEHTNWRISGPQGAAKILGLIPTTLHSRMKKLGISRRANNAGRPPG